MKYFINSLLKLNLNISYLPGASCMCTNKYNIPVYEYTATVI